MSILSQNISDIIDGCVSCQAIIEEYRPRKWNQKLIAGVIGNSLYSRPEFDKLSNKVVFRSKSWDFNAGLHSSEPIVIAGVVDFAKYNIPEISSDHHISIFPHECKLENLPPIRTPDKLVIHEPLSAVRNVDLTADMILFKSPWATAEPVISNSKIKCGSLKFLDGLPILRKCAGDVDTLSIRCFDIANNDTRFGSWIVSGIYNGGNTKSVSKWRDLRAIVNLTKYKLIHAPVLQKFFDLSHLEKDLGVENMNLKQLRFRDSGVELSFAKINNQWQIVAAIKH